MSADLVVPLFSTDGSIETLCMACSDASCDFKPMSLKRRACGPNDIVIDMKFCGVCHTDLHVAAGHLGITPTRYPCVPGHELAGVCVQVGSNVTKFKTGDQVGVGCMVDSCLNCSACRSGEEQLCSKQTATYNGANRNGRAGVFPPGSQTLGGYTKTMIVHERFGILIPETYPLTMAGPVMCAGITMYDPMIKAKLPSGASVGIIGLGGLGVMGLKIANAMGFKVTAISRSLAKKELALRSGASKYLVSESAEDMRGTAGTFDLILNTIPSYHNYNIYTPLLNRNGRQVLLGLHSGLAAAMIVNQVTFDHSRIIHSGIGGIRATQEVINLCNERKIYPEVQVVPCSQINAVFDKLDSSNETGVRYVLDIGNSLNEHTTEECLGMKSPTLKPAENALSLFPIITECLALFCCCRWC